VGRLELWKGVHHLLNAASKFTTADLELKLIGRVLDEIQPFLRQGSPLVLGALSREEISLHLSEADVLFLPSLNDSFGLVILEAMLHGVPVVTTSATAGPDIISDGNDGWLIRANDQAAVEQAIGTAIQNRQRLVDMGEAARQKVLARYLKSHYFARLADNLRKAQFLT
jgi:glycosyltransferase involved in cell wall biosynthesis